MAPGGTVALLSELEARQPGLAVNMTRAVLVRAGVRLLAALTDRELETALRDQWRAEADQRYEGAIRRLGSPPDVPPDGDEGGERRETA
jgi:hypothetical protein